MSCRPGPQLRCARGSCAPRVCVRAAAVLTRLVRAPSVCARTHAPAHRNACGRRTRSLGSPALLVVPSGGPLPRTFEKKNSRGLFSERHVRPTVSNAAAQRYGRCWRKDMRRLVCAFRVAVSEGNRGWTARGFPDSCEDCGRTMRKRTERDGAMRGQ